MAIQTATDEANIRQRINRGVEALHTMDLEGVMSLYAPDIVSFDLVAPLRHVGAMAKEKNWADAFTMFQRPLGYRIFFRLKLDWKAAQSEEVQAEVVGVSSGSLEADDGTRTHDLLHGKRVHKRSLDSAENRMVERQLALFPVRSAALGSPPFAGDSARFGHKNVACAQSVCGV